jgi:HEPN domain-containing protein
MANTEADKIDPLEKAKRAFVSAESFLEVAKVLLDAVEQGHTRILTLALATNSSFALEMYLKSLLLVENGDAPRTHDIHDLFHALKESTRRDLTTDHDKWVSEHPGFVEQATKEGLPTDLEELLKLGKDAFSKFRYSHEKIPSETNWGLNALSFCVSQRLLQLHPEWKTALDELAKEVARKRAD